MSSWAQSMWAMFYEQVANPLLFGEPQSKGSYTSLSLYKSKESGRKELRGIGVNG